jgi:hypothetical protein
VTDLRRYSSSSTVPFRPDPTFLSIFRFDFDVRLIQESKIVASGPSLLTDTYLEVLEAEVGATVYRVKAVAGAETSVITSTLCIPVSSSFP